MLALEGMMLQVMHGHGFKPSILQTFCFDFTNNASYDLTESCTSRLSRAKLSLYCDPQTEDGQHFKLHEHVDAILELCEAIMDCR